MLTAISPRPIFGSPPPHHLLRPPAIRPDSGRVCHLVLRPTFQIPSFASAASLLAGASPPEGRDCLSFQGAAALLYPICCTLCPAMSGILGLMKMLVAHTWKGRMVVVVGGGGVHSPASTDGTVVHGLNLNPHPCRRSNPPARARAMGLTWIPAVTLTSPSTDPRKLRRPRLPLSFHRTQQRPRPNLQLCSQK